MRGGAGGKGAIGLRWDGATAGVSPGPPERLRARADRATTPRQGPGIYRCFRRSEQHGRGRGKAALMGLEPVPT